MGIVTLIMNPAVDVFRRLPRVAPADELRLTSVRRDAGGRAINVARVATGLGEHARAVFPIGGPIGDLLRQLVEREGSAEVVALTLGARGGAWGEARAALYTRALAVETSRSAAPKASTVCTRACRSRRFE